MSQYEVAELLSESGDVMSKTELANRIGVVPATVGETLRELRMKGYAERVGMDQFCYHRDRDPGEISKLKPLTFSMSEGPPSRGSD